MQNKEDYRKQSTRKALFDTVFRLIETEQIDKLSVVDICREANIHRTTFYSHFEDKYHLVYCAFHELRERLFDGFSVKAKEMPLIELSRLTAIIIFDYIEKHYNAVWRIFSNNKNNVVREILRRVVERSIYDMLLFYKGKIEYRLPVSVISGFLAGGFINLGMMYVGNSHMKINKQELTHYIDIILEEGLYIPQQ
ncbi:TetR/AcrR family transcriptional regulator [bacterium]|nr:TetR/AcrR family transcriptional regulator [bacterium]